MNAIQSAFEFDDATLNKNQSGELSERQRQKLNIYQRHASTSFRLVSIALIGTGVLLVGAWAASNPISRETFQTEMIAFGSLGAILLLVNLYNWMSYRRLMNRLIHGEIQHIQGTISKYQQKIPRLKMTAYYIEIGSTRFQVDKKEKWEALDDRKSYLIHYINYPPTHIILSVETY